jgi:hypothetical protein
MRPTSVLGPKAEVEVTLRHVRFSLGSQHSC